MIVMIVCGFLGAVILYLSLITLLPGIQAPEQKLHSSRQPAATEDTRPVSPRKDVSFFVNGTRLSAWLYLPEGMSEPVPCVILGNGTGGTKEVAGLERYAARYLEAGLGALIFDYRFFGESEGRPRQLIWIPHQLEDYRGAVRYVRGLKEIDPERIALWGTSLSGGHVIVIASEDPRIACVIAQCPGMDGRAAAKRALETKGLGYLLRFVMHGQRDYLRGLLGLSPHRIPIVGREGSLALMNNPGELEFFERFVPPDFINETCARIVLRGDKYRPIQFASKVSCPVLLQICEKDDIIPLESSREAERQLGENAEAHYYPMGHFDIYTGEGFERAVQDQVNFLKKKTGANDQ